MGSVRSRALGTAAGLLADRVVGEPPVALHPVAGFGRLMGRVEQALWVDRRSAGVGYTVVGLGVGAATGLLVRPTAIAVACTCAGRELRTTAAGIADLLAAGDIEAARSALPALVGRDPARLDASGIAAAVIESVAENSVDAVVAPASWAVVAGAPGAWAYRAANTMDAMVGHRGSRYGRFGWASARFDDLVNVVPARLLVALTIVCRPGRARHVLKAVRRDAAHHPSPNAGVAEAAFAAALGVELGGPLRYGDRTEDRPCLGEGRRPGGRDIARAVALADDVERALVLLLLTGSLLPEFPRSRQSRQPRRSRQPRQPRQPRRSRQRGVFS